MLAIPSRKFSLIQMLVADGSRAVCNKVKVVARGMHVVEKVVTVGIQTPSSS